jgi:hypothetical protein
VRLGDNPRSKEGLINLQELGSREIVLAEGRTEHVLSAYISLHILEAEHQLLVKQVALTYKYVLLNKTPARLEVTSGAVKILLHSNSREVCYFEQGQGRKVTVSDPERGLVKEVNLASMGTVFATDREGRHYRVDCKEESGFSFGIVEQIRDEDIPYSLVNLAEGAYATLVELEAVVRHGQTYQFCRAGPLTCRIEVEQGVENVQLVPDVL